MPDKITVKFSDICREFKLSSKDPIADGYNRYVGLEHLDSGSLKIRRWGMLEEDSPTFTRVFKKGHILFGKRRPYLKKAAIAEFDGVCSSDIIVLESKPNTVVSYELLPYIIQSEPMWNWAVLHSAGSLSPRTNFSSIAKLSISLPSNPQDGCLPVLRAAERAIYRTENVLTQLKQSKIKTAYSLMLAGNNYQQLFGREKTKIPSGWKLITIGDVLTDTQYGLSDSLESDGRYPVLRMMNITNGYVDPNDLKYLDWKPNDAEKYILKKGDIVFNRTNSMEWVGRTGIFELDGDYLFASYLIRLIADEAKLTPYYLTQYLNLPIVQYRLKAFATPGVSQANINPGSLKSLPILVPPLGCIQKIDKVLREFDKNHNIAKEYHQRMNELVDTIKSTYFE
ncbi:restriction endonuclease subunit S [Enterobacter hormaechei]|uniref:restriction endonuclease subunit S n=1 Tax=Enterobacter hormaechei TaxID=158836 RepID=UPI000BB80DA0|nr:restriction endonuclease subunit S [Enterobacter hormaechei]MCE1931705.1 restriction endonuclease subunit S [Enterobacter hormaechei]